MKSNISRRILALLLTLAMILTLIPNVFATENPFTDVKDDAYYYDPVMWAVENGITAGTSETTFSPNKYCTRGQIVTFLWRAYGEPEPTSTDNPFTDVAADAYYIKPVLWAVEQNITAGTDPDKFSPNKTCTRGQAVTFMWRAAGEPEPSSTDNPFTDVAADAYYQKAVLWAAEKGITQGTSETTFSPNDKCTRGQIVTFLFRALADQGLGDLTGKTVILHTNDTHGALMGFAQVAKVKADYEAAGANVILVDAGDYSQGTAYVSLSKGETAVTMMNEAGYDYATLGNHEFDYGWAQLKQNLEKAEFKPIVADVIDEATNQPIYDGHVIKEFDGLKVGFFGMETPEASTKANPALIQGLLFPQEAEMYAIAQAEIDALKEEGADIIIGLTHLGVDDESEPNRSIDLYANVTGVDFIIDGHSHTVMTEGPNGEPIQSTGTKASDTALMNVGLIQIDNETKTIEKNELIPLGADAPVDETVAAAAQEIMDAVDAEYGEVFARSEVELNGDRAPGNRNMETNLGDLITDSMLWSVTKTGGLEVDEDHVVAITNGGGIRAWIHKGDVTKKDVNTVLPFGNTVAVVYVTGAELLEALEASTYCTPTAVGGFPQIAGMKITIDTGKEFDQGEQYPGSTYYGPKTIQRVTIDEVNGKPFDPEAKYAVITNNFCAAGGDTYYVFSNASGQFDTGLPLDEVLMDYIVEELDAVIKEDPYAEPQGRINFVESKPDYVLAGWINGAACFDEDATDPSPYVFEDGKLTATFTENSYVFVKYADGSKGFKTDGWLGEEVTSATLYDATTLDKPDKLFVPGNVELLFTLTENDDDTLTLSYELAEKPSVETVFPSTSNDDIAKYGNIYTDLDAAAFFEAGFTWGDVVTVKFLDKELELPVVPTFSYVDQGTPGVFVNKDGETGEPVGRVFMAINMGDFATTYGLAYKTTNADKTYFWTAVEGVEFPVPVQIEMKEAGGYATEMEIRDINRTNNREDYPELTDAEFANFRQITTSGMGDHLYRGSSPINPEIGRNTYADAELEKAGVTVIMNLADAQATAEAYPGYADTYYSKQNIVFLNLGVDFLADDFKAGLAVGLKHFAENEGVYYVHCTEGKDRAGFVSALLECFMGATYDEVVADYLKTYQNYYTVVDGVQQPLSQETLNAIAESNIIKTLKSAFEVEDLKAADLAKEAEDYIKALGLTDEEVEALRINLGGGAVKPDYVLAGWINGAACFDEGVTEPSPYVFEDGKLTASFTEDSYVFVKLSDGSKEFKTDGWQGTEVTSATLYDATTLSSPDKLFVPGGEELEFTLTENDDGTLTLAYFKAITEPVSIRVFETTDIHGYLLDASTGNEETFQYRLAYLAKIFNDARASEDYDDVLLLDGGDIYQGTPVSNLLQGRAIRAALDKMGYDAVALGNHEFDWGVTKNADAQGTIPAYEIGTYSGDPDIPIVAYNLYYADSGEPVNFTKDYVIVEKAGYKIAIVGYIPNYRGDIMAAEINPYIIDEDVTKLAAKVHEVNETEKPDITIVLAHESPKGLANALDPAEVDLVAGGHSHSGNAGVAGSGVAYIQGNCQAKGYASATIQVTGAPGSNPTVVVEEPKYTNTTSNSNIPNLYDTPENADKLDPVIVEISHLAWDAVKDDMAEVLGYVDVSVDKTKVSDNGATVAGNWISGLMLRGTADLAPVAAFYNSGGIRTTFPIPEGQTTRNITTADIYTINPFDNCWLVFELTAPEIAQQLLNGFINGNFGDQMSGLTFTYWQEGSGKNAERGIVSITLSDGTELDLNDNETKYRICTTNYSATLDGSVFLGKEPLVPMADAPIDNVTIIKLLREEGLANDGYLAVDTSKRGTKVDKPVEPVNTEFEFLVTSDLHGQIYATDYTRPYEQSGTYDRGLTRVSTYIKEQKAAFDDNVYVVDMGDTFQGAPLTYYYAFNKPDVPDPAILAFRTIGYDMWVVGNHEFNYGLPILTRQMDYAVSPSTDTEKQLTISMANYLKAETNSDESKDWATWRDVAPYVIKDFDGYKVAIIGFGNPNIPKWDVPANWEGIYFANIIETYKHYEAEMLEKADMIVVVAHSGIDSDPGSDFIKQLINETNTIAFAFSGHEHGNQVYKTTNSDGKEIPILQPYTKARAIAQVKVTVENGEPTIAPEIKNMQGYAVDEALAELLKPYEVDTWENYMLQPIGQALGDYPAANLGTAPSAFMDLINTVQAWGAYDRTGLNTPDKTEDDTKAMLSISAPLTSGSNANLISQGPIVLGDMFGLYRFENWFYQITMNGEEVHQWLEFAATKIRVDDEGNPYVTNGDLTYYDVIMGDGFHYDIDVSKPEGERVTCTYNGQPVTADTQFTVVVNNYRYNGGGNYVKWLNDHGCEFIANDPDRIIYSTQFDMIQGEDEGQARALLVSYIKDQTEKNGGITPFITSDWTVSNGGPVEEPDYVLAGWINGADYSDGANWETPSEYVFVDGKLDVKFTADSYVFVKLSDNSTGWKTNGWLGTEVSSATLYNWSKLPEGVNADTLDKLYVPGNTDLTLTLVDNGDDTLTLSYAPAAPAKVETSFPSATKADIDKYGDVHFSISSADLAAAGFEYKDLVKLSFLDQELIVPVIPQYRYVGAKAVGLVMWEDGTKAAEVEVFNGSFAATYGLADVVRDGSEYTVTPKEGVEFPVAVTIEMYEKQGYADTYAIFDLARSNNREDYLGNTEPYPNLTDEEFANFRKVTTTGMGAGALYRASSPINPSIGRNTYADAAAQAAGVKSFVNLADSESSAAKYAGYADSYYSQQNIAFLNLGVDFTTELNRAGVKTALEFIAAESTQAPILVHCNEGQDRAGFVSALLECLMGATYDEVVTDYMVTFYNYYGVQPGTDQYKQISNNIVKNLSTAFGLQMDELATADLAAEAEAYLKELGVSDETIAAAKAKLGSAVVTEP